MNKYLTKYIPGPNRNIHPILFHYNYLPTLHPFPASNPSFADTIVPSHRIFCISFIPLLCIFTYPLPTPAPRTPGEDFFPFNNQSFLFLSLLLPRPFPLILPLPLAPTLPLPPTLDGWIGLR